MMADADSKIRFWLQILMRPYILQQDGHTDPNLWGPIESERPPTSSPPLRHLRGAIDLRIFNNASSDVPVQIFASFSGIAGY